jgi:hypothetical protein
MGVGSNLWFDVRKPAREIEIRNMFFITGTPRLLILFERLGLMRCPCSAISRYFRREEFCFRTWKISLLPS